MDDKVETFDNDEVTVSTVLSYCLSDRALKRQPAVTVDRKRISSHLWPRSEQVSRNGQQWTACVHEKQD